MPQQAQRESGWRRDANKLIICEALRRLGPNARLDPTMLQEQIAVVVKEQGETIFVQLSVEARQQLRREGLRINERTARLGRINEAIVYGRFLVAKYKVETLGELPQEEQLEFARLWENATGGPNFHEN
jgi:hypothetical protein